MGKNNDNLIKFGSLDPAVEAAIHGHEKNRVERSMPLVKRRKLKKERERAEKRQPRRLSVDMDVDLIYWAKETGDKHACTRSQIIQLAVQRLMDDVDSGAVNLLNYRLPADGPRYENQIFRFPVDENGP